MLMEDAKMQMVISLNRNILECKYIPLIMKGRRPYKS